MADLDLTEHDDLKKVDDILCELLVTCLVDAVDEQENADGTPAVRKNCSRELALYEQFYEVIDVYIEQHDNFTPESDIRIIKAYLSFLEDILGSMEEALNSGLLSEAIEKTTLSSMDLLHEAIARIQELELL